jgi:hypothetical protein
MCDHTGVGIPDSDVHFLGANVQVALTSHSCIYAPEEIQALNGAIGIVRDRWIYAHSSTMGDEARYRYLVEFPQRRAYKDLPAITVTFTQVIDGEHLR